MNTLYRRKLIQLLAAAPWLVALPGHAQPQWPDRPVRIVSPYGAGGSNDTAARLIAEQLSRRLGVPFVVENKPGAATRLANEMVARSAPDGSSFLFAAAPYATVAAFYGKLSYDPKHDLVPVTLAVTAPLFLVVNAELPVQDLRGFIAYAKTRPQGLTFAGTGVGAVPHLVSELFLRQAQVKGLVVQFRGDATAYTELLAGRVDATLTALTTALPHVQSGKLRVLAVASEQRSPIYPSAPTFAEQGVPDVVGYGWFGFMAPASTPAPVIDRLNREVNAVLADPAVKSRMQQLGLQSVGDSPAEFGQFIDSEARKWGDIIKAAGIQAE